jgi:hypothetical protein
MTDFFMAHGVPDPAAVHQQAIIALGNTVKRQTLVMRHLCGDRRGPRLRRHRRRVHPQSKGGR